MDRIEGDIQMTDKGNLSVAAEFGCTGINPKACRGCANASGEAPWADGPEKTYCKVYRRDMGHRKPSDVYYGGGECNFREVE